VAEEEAKQGGQADDDHAGVAKAAEEAAERAAALASLTAKVEAEKVALADAKALQVDLEAATEDAMPSLEKRAEGLGITTSAPSPLSKGLGALFDKAAAAKPRAEKPPSASGDAAKATKAKASLPEDLAEALASLALASGSAGMDKVAEQFRDAHEGRNLTKREVKDWLDLHLLRDTKAGWRRRTVAEAAEAKAAFEAKAAAKPPAAGGGAAAEEGAKTKGEKRKPGGDPAALGAPPSSGKKGKSDGGSQKQKASPKKRKSGPSAGPVVAGNSSVASSILRAPKKPPAARAIFSKAKRAEVREGMRAVEGEGATTSSLSLSVEAELLKRWGLLPAAEVLTYEAQARVEADKYTRDLKVYKEAVAAMEREASKADAALPKKAKGDAPPNELAIPKKSSAGGTSTPRDGSGLAAAAGAAPQAAPLSPSKSSPFSIPKKAKPAQDQGAASAVSEP
jgi:hypothetical protein